MVRSNRELPGGAEIIARASKKEQPLKSVKGEIKNEVVLTKEKSKTKEGMIAEAYKKGGEKGLMDFLVDSNIVLSKEDLDENQILRAKFQKLFKKSDELRFDDFYLSLPEDAGEYDRIRAEFLDEARKEMLSLRVVEKERIAKEKKEGPKNLRNEDTEFSESIQAIKDIRKIEKDRVKKEKEEGEIYVEPDNENIKSEEADESKQMADEQLWQVGKKRKAEVDLESKRMVDELRQIEKDRVKFEAAQKRKESAEDSGDEVKQVFNAPRKGDKKPKDLAERMRASKKVDDFMDDILVERAKGLENRIKEINLFFLNKYGAAKPIHDMLMGPEIKGWFKGKERRLQAEYKSIAENPVYKRWVGEKERIEKKAKRKA